MNQDDKLKKVLAKAIEKNINDGKLPIGLALASVAIQAMKDGNKGST